MSNRSRYFNSPYQWQLNERVREGVGFDSDCVNDSGVKSGENMENQGQEHAMHTFTRPKREPEFEMFVYQVQGQLFQSP